MNFRPNQKLALASFFLTLALVLPFLTGQIPEIGNRLLPMHLPILLCGFFCGPKYGTLVGAIAPLFRSLIFGMPPMMPVAVSMSFELATYGLITGVMFMVLPKRLDMILITLIIAMIGGRVVAGFANTFLYATYSWEIFITMMIVNAIPGIIIQVVIIPAIIVSLLRLYPDQKKAVSVN